MPKRLAKCVVSKKKKVVWFNCLHSVCCNNYDLFSKIIFLFCPLRTSISALILGVGVTSSPNQEFKKGHEVFDEREIRTLCNGWKFLTFQVLAEIRPYLAGTGGGILELIQIDDYVVRVRLSGPAAGVMTVRVALTQKLREKIPSIAAVQLIDWWRIITNIIGCKDNNRQWIIQYQLYHIKSFAPGKY